MKEYVFNFLTITQQNKRVSNEAYAVLILAERVQRLVELFDLVIERPASGGQARIRVAPDR